MEECSSTPFLLHTYLIPDAILSHLAPLLPSITCNIFWKVQLPHPQWQHPPLMCQATIKKKQNNCRHYFQTQPRITDVHCAASQVKLQKPRSLWGWSLWPPQNLIEVGWIKPMVPITNQTSRGAICTIGLHKNKDETKGEKNIRPGWEGHLSLLANMAA